MGRGVLVLDGSLGSLDAVRWAGSLSRAVSATFAVMNRCRTGSLLTRWIYPFRAVAESWQPTAATGWLHRVLDHATHPLFVIRLGRVP